MQNIHGPMSLGPTSKEAFAGVWLYIIPAVEIMTLIVKRIYRKIARRLVNGV